MTVQMRKRGGVAPQFALELTPVGDDRIVASTAWHDAEGRRDERFQVLTIRDGKIADLQGCETRREAERFARRRDR